MNRAREMLMIAGLTLTAAALVTGAISPGSIGLTARTFAAAPLSDDEIRILMAARGFTDVQNIRHDGAKVLMTATKNGQTGEIAVSDLTGNILRDGGDDDDDD